MNRRRTVAAYAVAGLVSLALAVVIGPGTIAGPGPLVVDPHLTVEIAGLLFLVGAVAFGLGVEPEWATPNGSD